MRRLFSCLTALVLAWAVPLLAAAPSLGSQTFSAASVSALVLTLINVDAGAAIHVIHFKENNSNRTMSVVDPDNGTYALIDSSGSCSSATCVEDYAIFNALANASLSITMTQAGGVFAAYSGGAVEINCAGAGTCAADASSHLVEGAATGSHLSSLDSTVIDTAANVFVLSGCKATGSLSTETPGSGYTALTESAPTIFWQFQSSVGALTDERGAWTSATTTRVCVSTISSTKLTAAPTARRGLLLGLP